MTILISSYNLCTDKVPSEPDNEYEGVDDITLPFPPKVVLLFSISLVGDGATVTADHLSNSVQIILASITILFGSVVHTEAAIASLKSSLVKAGGGAGVIRCSSLTDLDSTSLRKAEASCSPFYFRFL